MNKRQLIATAARRSSLTQGQVREALEAVQEVITCALANGDHPDAYPLAHRHADAYPDTGGRCLGR